ncbi:multidrug transporter [Lacticaseibacillus rhamnosus]|uniref:LexA family transcriptional regulator n=1 Tax=Lacticaseibacillus rhamnosus TaxID=47715 RepID=UPI0007DAFF5D|nr:multidrug transporter [Lacticaseibacillus rhamnosus]
MTQADLSRITGIAQNTISNHENQNRALDENSIIKYAKALGVTPQALYDAAIVKKSIDTKSMVIDVRQTAIDEINDVVKELVTPRVQKVASYAEKQLNEQQNPDNVVSLDEARVERNLDEPELNVEVDGIVAAGYGAFNDDRYEPMDTVKIPDSAIPLHYDYCFKVVGDSMSPYYEDGEFVFVQKTQDVTNGMIAVVDIDDMTFIKKLILEQDRLCLRSLNDDVDEKTGKRIYPDFYADDTDNIQVIGKVVGSYAFN